MHVNPIDGRAPAGAQPTTRTMNSPLDQSGGAQAATSQQSAAGQSSSLSASASSLSISATQMSTSQSISALMTSFAPYAADQDLMKLLLLLIVLQILLGEEEESRSSAGLLMFQAESSSTYQSLEISQSEAHVSYGLSTYGQQSQVVSGSSAGHQSGDAGTGGQPGRSLDLQG